MLRAERSGILVAGVLALVLGWARPADAQQPIKVGSFAKDASGAPATQVVPHGLGQAPKALILWTDGKTDQNFSASFLYAFGMTDGTTSFSNAASSLNNAAGVPTVNRRLADKALAIVSPTGVRLAEADLQSWDTTNFTLSWAINDATPYVIHFIAIGGPAVSAKVVNWQMPVNPGNTSVTVGFSPDVVLHAHLGAGFTSTPPAGQAGAHFGFGVMDKNGGQWATDEETWNGAPTMTRGQQTNACLYAFNNTRDVQKVASFVSMDATGFTVNFAEPTGNMNQGQVISLALKGVAAKAGSFPKSTTVPNVTQPVSGMGFGPSAVLLASFQDVTPLLSPPAQALAEMRFGIGAADRTGGQGASAVADKDGANPTITQGIDKTSKAFVKVNNNTPTIDAEANVSTFDPDGFTLNWTTNDAVATQMLYLALVVPTVNYRSIGTRADYGTTQTDGNGSSVTATLGSTLVTGSGTVFWRTSNRGRGDVIEIDGVPYTVAAVNSETQLTLATAHTGVSTGGKAYRIRRQFATLQGWEDCVSFAGACPYFPVASASLVADNRREVGIAYKDSTFTPVAGQNILIVQGSTTGPSHDITLTVDPGNRHNGVAGTGVILDNGANTIDAVDVQDEFVTVEWLEIKGGAATQDGLQVPDTALLTLPNQLTVRNCLIHNVGGNGITVQDFNATMDIYNNILYGNPGLGVSLDPLTQPFAASTRQRVLNNTVFGNTGRGIGSQGVALVNPTVTLQNNIAVSNASPNFNVAAAGLNLAGSDNLASDTSGTTDSPGGGGINNVTATASPTTCPSGNCVGFNNVTAGSQNLHLITTTYTNQAVNTGADLSAIFLKDIDNQPRPTGVNTWDIGADELMPATAVALMSFSASGVDGAVDLSWQTGSELDNLGFHLYRSSSDSGPWTRLTSSLIPGLGSSPVGATYSWGDSGLVNGTRYFYRLEDVDTRSVSTFHGPVSAVPSAGAPAPPPAPGGGGGSGPGGSVPGPGNSSCPAWVLSAYAPSASGSSSPPACQSFGDPVSSSLHLVSRSSEGAVVELLTGGFVALREPSGSVRVFVPGLELPSDPSSPALPFKRALVEAVVGRGVRLGSVEAFSLLGYRGLRPSAVGTAEMAFFPNGTVRPSQRPAAVRSLSRGYLPREQARLAGVVFQGEDKRAVLEITPVRFDAAHSQLVLARRVRVRLLFAGEEASETGTGSRGRRVPPMRFAREVLAQLYTSSRGLHAVRFEQLFPLRRGGFSLSTLRLQRQGLAVPLHIAPVSSVFGPGSVLYFFADTLPSSTAFSGEIAYELVRSSGGQTMAVVPAPPAAAAALSSASLASASFEDNRIYQSGLLDAPDIWLWDALWGGVVKTESFSLSGVDSSSSLPARLVVFLQGGSDAEGVVDHHLRLSLNGTFVGETRFDGKVALRFDTTVPASLLREGSNDLTLENVGDTGVYSLVLLDKFSLLYPQTPSSRGGVFEGTWTETGVAEVSVSSPAVLLDVTGTAAADGIATSASSTVQWLTAFETSPSAVRFSAQAGHRYVLASPGSLLSPRISIPAPSSLRSRDNQADFIVIAPQAFLPAAPPLLERRQSQGLSTRAVSLEEIASVFGHGEPSAQAIHDFLTFAFHSWARPSPRYVLLLGESTYDPRNFTTTAHPSPLPALWTKTSYLWTVSDPTLAAVNGDDPLPDLAIGRLPATTVEEAQGMIAKVLDWEDSGQNLDGKAVLVADNPDQGGDFEADTNDIAESFLAARHTQLIFLSQLGSETRPAILDAFNQGASLVSYVGHGGTAVWASENILNSWDAPSLQAQSQQPFMVAMNCLSGYFVAPNFDALSEAFLKPQGRGSIAAFSPTGLSLDAPAHLYHRALMAEITSGRHQRLGDALLAAQEAYTQTGSMPELLSIYHLFGDPTMRLRP
jgi:hypothetical protein